jgi:formate hydrogenlyase subunit 4
VTPGALLRLVVVLLAAPLLLGLINRVKAFSAGRSGQPLLQVYFDLAKLFRKGAVYSRTTTWHFRAGPILSLAAAVVALAIVPLAGGPALVSFSADLLLLAGLLSLARFATVLAALDTGSSFEAMGASREVLLGALAEPALLVALVALGRMSGSASTTALLAAVTPTAWRANAAALALVAAAMVVVFLTENARVPIDDPTTHLELTMIHEVMVLDHSGPDLALLEAGAAAKLAVLGSLVVGILVPYRSGPFWFDATAFAAGMVGLSLAVGVIESTMARMRLLRLPQLLVAAGVLSVLAFVLLSR